MDVDEQRISASDEIAERTNIAEAFQALDVIQNLRRAACIDCLPRAFSKFIAQFGFTHRMFGAALRMLSLARKGLAVFQAHGNSARPSGRIALFQIGIEIHLHALGEFQHILIPDCAVGENMQPDLAIDDCPRHQIWHAEFPLNSGLRHAEDNSVERVLNHIHIHAVNHLCGQSVFRSELEHGIDHLMRKPAAWIRFDTQPVGDERIGAAEFLDRLLMNLRIFVSYRIKSEAAFNRFRIGCITTAGELGSEYTVTGAQTDM